MGVRGLSGKALTSEGAPSERFVYRVACGRPDFDLQAEITRPVNILHHMMMSILILGKGGELDELMTETEREDCATDGRPGGGGSPEE